MLNTFKNNSLGAYLGLSTDYLNDRKWFSEYDNLIAILWNRNENEVLIQIDNVPVALSKGSLTTITFSNKIESDSDLPLTAFVFNREFYCIRDHDEEVSCNGLIFFGVNDIPVVTLDDKEKKSFELLLSVFEDEFSTRDNIQGEMLQMLLKRLIIKITRLVKQQLITESLDDDQIDIVRKFNTLVDAHFREKKKVADYADLLFRSPKTLSNLFSKYNQKSPLQIIHDRIILEAKRLLLYTDMSNKEVAIELGLNDVSSFQKLFKNNESMTPLEFRQNNTKGKITNH